MSDIDIAIILPYKEILSNLVSKPHVRGANRSVSRRSRSPVYECVIKAELENELLKLALDLASSRVASIRVRSQNTQ